MWRLVFSRRLKTSFPPVPADTAVAFGAFLSGTGRISAWTVFGSHVGWETCPRRSGCICLPGIWAVRFSKARWVERLLKPSALTRLEKIYEKYGTWGIFFSRFVPALRALVPPFAGVASVGAVKTIIPLAVASALWYGAITYLAATFVREFDEIKRIIFQFNRIAGLSSRVWSFSGSW